MGVLTREELDALIRTISRRWHLWAMHNAQETLSGAPRTLTPAYADHVLLYEAIT